jgi:hypothetical protein
MASFLTDTIGKQLGAYIFIKERDFLNDPWRFQGVPAEVWCSSIAFLVHDIRYQSEDMLIILLLLPATATS